eukprot:scaffold64468_cov50-Attheya_sp.AAC.3
MIDRWISRCSLCWIVVNDGKFILIHVVSQSGTTNRGIENARWIILRVPFCLDDRVGRRHREARGNKAKGGNDLHDEYFVFGVVRFAVSAAARSDGYWNRHAADLFLVVLQSEDLATMTRIFGDAFYFECAIYSSIGIAIGMLKKPLDYRKIPRGPIFQSLFVPAHRIEQ